MASNEVENLNIVLEFIRDNKLNWISKFVLFAWLSNLILIPFDLTKLSSKQSIVMVLYKLTLDELQFNGKQVEPASLAIARLINRLTIFGFIFLIDLIAHLIYLNSLIIQLKLCNMEITF